MTENWIVYIVACADETLYTGITKDLDRRILEHNHSSIGAKYTRSRRPVTLVYNCILPDKPSALKEEIRLKKLPRKTKLLLIGAVAK